MVLLLTVLGLAPVFLGSRAYFRGLTQVVDIRDKEIVRADEPNEPLEVVGLQTNQKSIEFGRIFRDEGDWLKNFSITYRNKSQQVIVSATFYLEFPETTSTGSEMHYPLSFGPDRLKAIEGARSILVHPNEDFTVNLNDAKLTHMKKFLSSRHLLESLRKVKISVGFLLFDDGTGWGAGSYRIQDPNRPGIWIDAPKKSEVKP